MSVDPSPTAPFDATYPGIVRVICSDLDANSVGLWGCGKSRRRWGCKGIEMMLKWHKRGFWSYEEGERRAFGKKFTPWGARFAITPKMPRIGSLALAPSQRQPRIGRMPKARISKFTDCESGMKGGRRLPGADSHEQTLMSRFPGGSSYQEETPRSRPPEEAPTRRRLPRADSQKKVPGTSWNRWREEEKH